MFKKSIYITLIQLAGIFLGLMTIYLIAGDMEPEVYAIIGVYQVVCNIGTVFSAWGIESVVCREVPYWNKSGMREKTVEYCSQAMFSRCTACLILTPFILGYLIYINQTRYDGQYTFLFFCLLIGSIVNSLIDTMRNVVRAEGGYVFVQIMSTLNTTILKFFGIIIYFSAGYMGYLYFYIFSSIPILLCFYYKCRKNFNWKYVYVRLTLKKIYSARYLWLKGDLEYLRSNLDSFLVSMLFPAGIMGSYTIYKNIEQIMKGFIEGFFDVLSQNTVQYKGDYIQLEKQEKKIKTARNLFIIAIIIGMGIYFPFMDMWIGLVNLDRYEGIALLILCVAITGVLYLVGKFEINAIAFLATTKMNFQLALVNAMGAFLTYVVVAVRPGLTTVIWQRILSYLIASLLAVLLFYKHKKQIYSEINH